MTTADAHHSQAEEWQSRLSAPDWLVSFFDTGIRARKMFQAYRKSEEYQKVFLKDEPLVSVCIGTYNRARLLTERTLPSLLRQTYENIELIIVGDACTDDTGEQVAKLGDERLRFINLPRRGDYPTHPVYRWMVAGTASMNHALSLAAGDFITHLDDDDEHASDRIEKLLDAIRAERADIVYHPFEWEMADGEWEMNQAAGFRYAEVTTSSVLYHNWFRQLDWDPFAYRFYEPGDWNRFRRMKYLGAKAIRYAEPLLKHYRERTQKS